MNKKIDIKDELYYHGATNQKQRAAIKRRLKELIKLGFTYNGYKKFGHEAVTFQIRISDVLKKSDDWFKSYTNFVKERMPWHFKTI